MKDTLTAAVLFVTICLQFLLFYQVQQVSEQVAASSLNSDQVKRELTFEINRVQDRCERDIGDLQEKLNMIETLLSRRF